MAVENMNKNLYTGKKINSEKAERQISHLLREEKTQNIHLVTLICENIIFTLGVLLFSFYAEIKKKIKR